MRRVKSSVYDRKYFETDCGGYELWTTTYGRILPPRLEYAWKIAEIKEGMKVLDWGCGRGELSYWSAKVGADVVGVDYSRDAISLCKKLPKDIAGSMEFVHHNQLSIPLPACSVDRILFIDVIEHLYPEQLAVLLKEFGRVLKKNGKIIIHTSPNLDYYNIGYPRYTRWAHKLVNPFWKIIFKERLREERDPRFGYDKKVHINECSLAMVREYLTKADLKPQVWYDSRWRMARRRDKLRYIFFQPLWFSNKLFADDIWAVASL